jgi:hypothetical protein
VRWIHLCSLAVLVPVYGVFLPPCSVYPMLSHYYLERGHIKSYFHLKTPYFGVNY